MVTIIVTNIRTLQNMDTSITGHLSIYSSFEVSQPFIRHSNIITDSQ